jgi:hypothetical protein
MKYDVGDALRRLGSLGQGSPTVIMYGQGGATTPDITIPFAETFGPKMYVVRVMKPDVEVLVVPYQEEPMERTIFYVLQKELPDPDALSEVLFARSMMLHSAAELERFHSVPGKWEVLDGSDDSSSRWQFTPDDSEDPAVIYRMTRAEHAWS